MKIWDHCVIYTADDEEPDCMICDHCQGSVLFKECRPKHGGIIIEEKSKILK